MRCVDCVYHTILLGQDWCDIEKGKPRRMSHSDAIKDVSCIKYDKEKRATNLNF